MIGQWQQQQQLPFNTPLSGTIQVSRYQKGKTNRDLLNQEAVSDSGIIWTIYKPSPCSRQINMPADLLLSFITCRVSFLQSKHNMKNTEGTMTDKFDSQLLRL